jgi:hypothetical protein
MSETLGRDFIRDSAWLVSQNYPSFTGLRDGSVVGAAGVIPKSTGIGEGWMLLSRNANRHDLLWIARQARTFLGNIQSDAQYLTVLAMICKEWPAAHRLARVLGFCRTDGIVTPHESGRDYIVYERH